jgi:hypothetical protein
MLKGKIEGLKQMFQAVHVRPSSSAMPKPKSSKPRKSVTPKQLKKHKADFDVDDVDLDHVGNKLLVSFFIPC